MARSWYGVSGFALAIGVASLVLANQVSSGAPHRGALVALFLSFLAATLTLLAVAVASSDRAVDERLEVGARWSLRAACRDAIGRVAVGTRTRLAYVGRMGRVAGAGATQARDVVNRAVTTAISEDRRRATRAALERRGHRMLVALGLTEPDVAAPVPATAGRPEHATAARRAVSHHARAARPRSASSRRFVVRDPALRR